MRRGIALLSLVLTSSAMGQAPSPVVWRYVQLKDTVPNNVLPGGRYMIETVFGTTRLWDLDERKIVRESMSRWNRPALLAPNGETFISTFGTSGTEVRRTSDFSLVKKVAFGPGIFDMAYAPDGSVWIYGDRYDGLTGDKLGKNPIYNYGPHNFGLNGRTLDHTVTQNSTVYPAFYDLATKTPHRYANGSYGILAARGDIALSVVLVSDPVDLWHYVLVAQRTSDGAEVWRRDFLSLSLDFYAPLGSDRIITQVGDVRGGVGGRGPWDTVILNAYTGAVLNQHRAPEGLRGGFYPRQDRYEAVFLDYSASRLHRVRRRYAANGELLESVELPPALDGPIYLDYFQATTRGVLFGSRGDAGVLERGEPDTFAFATGLQNPSAISVDGRRFFDPTRGLIDTRTKKVLAPAKDLAFLNFLPDGRMVSNGRAYKLEGGALVPYGPDLAGLISASPDGSRTLHAGAGNTYTVRDGEANALGSFQRALADREERIGTYVRGDQVVFARTNRTVNPNRRDFEYWRVTPEGSQLMNVVSQEDTLGPAYVLGPGGRTTFWRKGGLYSAGKYAGEIRRVSDGKLIVKVEETDSMASDEKAAWSPDGSLLYILRGDRSIIAHEVPVFLDETRVKPVNRRSAKGQVLLTRNAPSGGTVVNLTSNSPYAVVPATVSVPSTRYEISYTVKTSPVPVPTKVTLKSSIGSDSMTTTLDLAPPVPISISTTPIEIEGGDRLTLSYKLDGPAPDPSTGWRLSLSSNAASVPVPATVSTVSMSEAGTVSLTTLPVTETVIATLRMGTQTVDVKVNPLVKPVFSPGNLRLVGGKSATWTLKADRIAPAEGFSFALTTNDPKVQLPATAFIPAGTDRITIPVQTSAVT
ncbi:hypothetical protein EON79_12755, partial [bacterium]